MRPARNFAIAAALLLLVANFGSDLTSMRDRQEAAIDVSLQRQAQRAVGILNLRLERASATAVLQAQNPTLAGLDRRRNTAASTGQRLRRAERALAFVDSLLPQQLAEVAVVDAAGRQLAAVSNGRVLTDNVRRPPRFLSVALPRLPPSGVYRSPPTRSPLTGEWVIATTTVIPGATRTYLRLTLRLEQLRRAIAVSGIRTRVLDRRTDRIILDSATQVRADRGLVPVSLNRLGRGPASARGGAGTVRTDRTHAAIAQVPSLPGNTDRWNVVASAARPSLAAAYSARSLAPTMLSIVVLLLAGFAVAMHQRELRRRTLTDALTGLPNRSGFERDVARYFSKRRGTPATGAVLILNIDRFQDVNDTLGHDTGDHVLALVGQRVIEAAPAGAVVGRVTGDEFALLVEAPSIIASRAAAERLLAALRAPFRVGGATISLDGSVGIAQIPEHGTAPDKLLQNADIAMYEAKGRHLGYLSYDPALNQASERRVQMVTALKQAIEARDITLVYQPKVSLIDGSVLGVEALARWEHPQFGFVAPDEFVALAEQTGQIHALSTLVVDEALRQTRVWNEQGISLQMSVNLSVRDLLEPRLVENVSAALRHRHVPAHQLTLEITESSAMAEADRATKVLNELRAVGVSLSIDDYGTGYSALSYLKHLPVTELKIDRSFVMNMASEPTDAAIVRSTIELALNLGLHVVAEGVEDEATLNRLGELGCTLAQGYHISRPVAPQALEAWLLKQPLATGL